MGFFSGQGADFGGGMGNPLGGAGFDFGMHKVPIIGNFVQNPDELHKQEQMQRAGAAYNAYRPEAQQARMNALRNVAAQYQPVNNALGQMYGPSAQMSQGAYAPPMSPNMMGYGAPMNQTGSMPGNGGFLADPLGSMGGMNAPGALLGSFGGFGGFF